MMDSLFTIAIMQFHLILAWIFWLGFQTLSCAARQDPILQVCNWTSLTQKDIQSENGVEQNNKNRLEINHAMRTTDFATEQFPLPPLQQVQLSIRTCRNFKQNMKIF